MVKYITCGGKLVSAESFGSTADLWDEEPGTLYADWSKQRVEIPAETKHDAFLDIQEKYRVKPAVELDPGFDRTEDFFTPYEICPADFLKAVNRLETLAGPLTEGEQYDLSAMYDKIMFRNLRYKAAKAREWLADNPTAQAYEENCIEEFRWYFPQGRYRQECHSEAVGRRLWEESLRGGLKTAYRNGGAPAVYALELRQKQQDLAAWNAAQEADCAVAQAV